MKLHCRSWFVMLIALCVLMPGLARAAVTDDLEYLGYSKELRDFAADKIQKTHVKPQSGATAFGMAPETGPIDEATAVQEQLTELGRTRSLTPQTTLATDEAKARLDDFWARMGRRGQKEMPYLSDEQKTMLKNRIRAELEGVGYTIKQIDLIDVPASLDVPQVRGVVRVVRPVTTKNPYREIQNNLAEIKELCLRAATIDGTRYLRELTTFIAENPQNNYYYEKTILNP
ncbi:MAG: hypothetical protein OZSIB_2905 [Candidatus Ozemobacter sibiricus]|jgi:hypothetical protein|uniref:Uncharacterized protein n=1 Tax=Candidatus Ozemobacter sibiricus TaxID=2268124 RepID=A0A367ZTA0_9BACT|nr:MAG: hypothetical protein OZSIB_2905 [Candidatus Ozemobacter sibiricus]